MSKLLRKILKASILPAAFMVTSKLVGIFLAVVAYNLPLRIAHEVDFFTVKLYLAEGTQAFVANSLASAILLITMNAATLVIFLKQQLYLQSQGSPRTVIKLSKLNLLKWITKNDGGFVTSFIWTFFLIATNSIIIGEVLLGKIFGILGVFAFLSTILFVWGLIRTFEIETATIYPKQKEAYS